MPIPFWGTRADGNQKKVKISALSVPWRATYSPDAMKGRLNMSARHYTRRQKQKWNRKFWDQKRREGWRFFGMVLPPEIADAVLDFKRQRMAEYRTMRAKRRKEG